MNTKNMGDIIQETLDALKKKRPIFHSEADFQFALAWEIKEQNKDKNIQIRLEYPSEHKPTERTDIIIEYNNFIFPIELKYKTQKIDVTNKDEKFHLKYSLNIFDQYHFIEDIERIEAFSIEDRRFKEGYVIWLTNNPYFWEKQKKLFSTHDGNKLTSGAHQNDKWEEKSKNDKKYKDCAKPIKLNHNYIIEWTDYSQFEEKYGLFKYSLITVPPQR